MLLRFTVYSSKKLIWSSSSRRSFLRLLFNSVFVELEVGALGLRKVGIGGLRSVAIKEEFAAFRS